MLGGAGLGEKAIERIRKLVTERLHIRSAATRDQVERFTRDVARLETQTQCLLEMRLKGELSPAEFAAQKKRIESELATAHAGAARQADVSREFDVDTAFDEAKPILADPARFWQELSDVAHKREFQKVVFKSHPSYNATKESFGTPKFSRVFRVFEGSDLTNPQNVAGAGFEPATFGFWLFAAITDSVGLSHHPAKLGTTATAFGTALRLRLLDAPIIVSEPCRLRRPWLLIALR